jgi:uncharacterized protein (TIGR02284 family)
MNNDNAVDVLNSLIVINNDRIAGYETAIEETEDADLKARFSQYIQTSQACKSELVAEVGKIGGKPEDGTRIDGKIYRSWMDFKSMVTGNDRKAILNSCEKGEDVALNTYQKALKDKDLPPTLNALVTNQYNKIKMNHNEVRDLRDAAVNA